MRNWSINTLPPQIKAAKIYFDTNFLLFLFSNEHPGINTAFTSLTSIGLLEGKPLFIDLTASQYVLFEFFENRKKIHYKAFLEQNGIEVTIEEGEEIFSKYQKFNYFKVHGHNYIDIFPQISALVENDLTRISEYSIRHEAHILNEKLFIPTKHLCLSSRISRHDCLITSSAVYPDVETTNFDIIIWTNDEDYKRGYNECTEIENIFSDCNIELEFIRSLKIRTGQEVNLLNAQDFGAIPAFMIKKIKEYLIQVNAKSYLGLTDTAPAAPNIIYIENRNNNLIKPRPSLTVIGKDLDFIINSSYIDEFWHNGAVLGEYPINTNDVISGRWTFPNAFSNEFGDNLDEIMAELKKPGHLVFVNEYYEEY